MTRRGRENLAGETRENLGRGINVGVVGPDMVRSQLENIRKRLEADILWKSNPVWFRIRKIGRERVWRQRYLAVNESGQLHISSECCIHKLLSCTEAMQTQIDIKTG